MKMVTERKKLIDVFPDKVGKIAQRLHQKKEDIPYVKKYYVADKQEKEEKERAVISYISTSVRDRDGDILLPEGVELTNYRKNPVVFYGHDYRGVPVGKNAWIKPDDVGLRAKTFFANTQRGEELHKAYTEDIEGLGPLLAGWSVGFIPLEWEDIEVKDKSKEKPGKKYTRWELLEYSAVGIPSCPEALTIAEEKGLIPKSVKKDIEYMIAKDEPEEEKELEVALEAPKVKAEWVIEKERVDMKKFWTVLKDDNKTEQITKPETTDQYHRIPVNPGCEVTATITISASQGIKAVYCGKVKKVHTYLFDVNKWTMEEAKKWVADHKDFTDALFELSDDAIMEKLKSDELIEEMALETEEKRFDLEGNPSVWDIMDSISLLVRTPIDSKTRRYVADLYPIDYPGGHVVIEETREKENRRYLLYSYEYNDGDIKLGESKELEAAYKPKKELDPHTFDELIAKEIIKELRETRKELAELKEGRVLRRALRNALIECRGGIDTVLKEDKRGTEEDEEQEETSGKTLILDPGVEIIRDKDEITPEDIDERVRKAFMVAMENFDPKKFEEAAEKGMRLAIDKVKGKVV